MGKTGKENYDEAKKKIFVRNRQINQKQLNYFFFGPKKPQPCPSGRCLTKQGSRRT